MDGYAILFPYVYVCVFCLIKIHFFARFFVMKVDV